MTQHPRVPWLLIEQTSRGYVIVDQRDGQRYEACCSDAVEQLVADLSGSRSHVGLGDVIHGIAKWLGFQRCSDCAERHVAANRAVPRLWRR